MSNAVELAIKVTADAKAAEAGLTGVTQKTSKMGKVGNLAGKALAAGLLIAVAAAVKLTGAAAEDAAAAASLANTMQTVAGATDKQVAATERWISAQGKALGVTDDELRPALDALVTSTKNVRQAQSLASLAMDISAKRGKSLQSVSAALAKAYATGNVSALAKYGVATKNADGSTKSLQQVTKALSATYKGSASAAADTVAGKQKRLQVQMSELGETIGYKLLPVMAKLVAVGFQVIGWIEKNQALVGIIVGTLGGLLAVTFAVSKVMQVWSAVTKVAAAAQWILNAAMSANPVGLVVLAIVALVVALVVAYKKSETFRKIVDGAFRAIAKVVGVVVAFIKKHWATMLAILTGPIGIAVLLIAKNWDKIKAGFKLVVAVVKLVWGKVRDILSGPFEHFRDVAGRVWEALKAGVRAAKAVVVGAFDAMKRTIDNVIGFVQKLIDKIQSIPGIPGGGGGAQVAGTGAVTTPPADRRGPWPPPPTQRGGDTYYVDQRGLLDTDQGAAKLIRLLQNNARRTGGKVVIVGG